MIFLDIGRSSINLDHVVGAYRAANGNVTIEFDVQDGDGPSVLTLYDDDAQAFKVWWGQHRELAGLIIIGVT